MKYFKIAQPYAKAILFLTMDKNSYLYWKYMLHYLSLIVQDPIFQNKILKNLSMSNKNKTDLIYNLNPSKLNKQGQNLLRLLAYHNRLMILPDLYKLYIFLWEERENKINMQLTVAQNTSANIIDSMKNMINKKKINVMTTVDKTLICGGIVRFNNRVIDNSLKRKLAILQKFISGN